MKEQKTVKPIREVLRSPRFQKGSVGALVFTGILFTADTLLTLFGPSWEAARGVLIMRGLLIPKRAPNWRFRNPNLTYLEESCKVNS